MFTWLGQEQLALQPARTTSAAAVCTSAAACAGALTQPCTLLYHSSPVQYHHSFTFTHTGETTRQCQRRVMVQRVLIDLNTDNGDAKPFGNLRLKPATASAISKLSGWRNQGKN